MNVTDLGFALIVELKSNIAEVIVKEGIEIDGSMLTRGHAFLEATMQSPYSLLVNKLYPYTYSFSAQQNLDLYKTVQSVAVVAYSSLSRVTTRHLINMTEKSQTRVEVFSNRNLALEWIVARNKSALPRSQG